MVRYLKLFLVILNHSTKRYLENRWSTFGQLFATSIEILIFVVLISYVFSFTNNLNGWDKNSVFLLIGISQLVSATYAFIFRRSVNRFPDLIRLGTMDTLLTKPFNSQFYSSIRYIKPFEILNTITGLVIIAYALSHLNYTFDITSWLLLLIGIFCGIVIIYSLCFSFAILAFWSPKLSSTSSFYELVTTPLILPTDIYGQPFSFLITFIIPVGLIVTIPTKIFLGTIGWQFIVVEIIMTALLLYLCTRFWKLAIKNYTSASS